MIEVVKYTPDKKEEWDEFVVKSDIPIFMFMRDYIEYHKERFIDKSLMFYKKNKLLAILPGHIINQSFYSHEGLTFGGLITQQNFIYTELKEIYNTINWYLATNNFKTIKLKLQPSIYSKTNSQAQTYLLQSNILEYSDLKLGACIYTKHHKFPKSSIEKRKLKLNQFDLKYSERFEEFWEILEKNLRDYHNTKPVHSLNEILYLKNKFPDSIKLYVAINKVTGNIDSGAILYKFNNVIKLQYQASSAEGKSNRASHALYYGFITLNICNFDYIDLGNCMYDINKVNDDLLYFKERFGATIYPLYSYIYSTQNNMK